MRTPATKHSCLLALLAGVAAPAGLASQVGGNLAALPAVELAIDITTDGDRPVLSQGEFELVTGDYYRVSVTSDGGADWRFEANDLLQNAHLRLVTVAGIEVHLQGMVFRAIELDQEGTAEFTFTPIRPGTYQFTVGNVPSATGAPIGAPGRSEPDRTAVGRFVVR
jgi:hypothetical protein